MADPNVPPRRVSMSYILGLTNKPFKDPLPPPPPRPPQPNALVQMVTTPGGLVEWTASDGRKGRLTGSGRQRLSAANLAKVPSVKDATRTKTVSKKAATEGGASAMGDMFGLFAGVTGNEDKKDDKKPHQKGESASGWTNQQDTRLMELKAENQPWTKIAEDVGKDLQQCKERFKQIKPRDWKPNMAKRGGDNAGNKKGGQSQENNQNSNNKNGGEGQKANGATVVGISANDPTNAWGAADKAGGDADAKTGSNGWCGIDTSGDNTANNGNKKEDTAFAAWGGGGLPIDGANDQSGGATNGGGWDTIGGPVDNGNSGAWDNNAGAGNDTTGGGWDTIAGAGNDTTAAGWGDTAATGNDTTAAGWDNTAGADATGTPWDNSAGAGNNTNGEKDTAVDAWGAAPAAEVCATTGPKDTNNSGEGIDSWNNNKNNTWPTIAPAQHSTKAASKAPTVKATSNHGATQNIIAAPLELEIKPDSTFSADDLRLIARILQQDCGLVWSRVSWRFKDKTGRTLHPDVFERKITGNVEGKGSDKGEKRRK